MAVYQKKEYNEIENLKYHFYKLLCNGKCDYDEFVDSLVQKSEIEELQKIKAIMDKVDVNNLPPSKYRHISSVKSKDRKDIYEFKSKHLRIYAIKSDPDYYLLLGGYKKTQEKDIEKVFRKYNDVPAEVPLLKSTETDE